MPYVRWRSPPYHVVISPLYIHGMILAEGIHDNMRAGAPVINVPHNMKVVDDKPLNQLAEGNNKLGALPIRIIVWIISL